MYKTGAFIPMKTIIFTTENTAFQHLEKLQCELKNVGIGSFNVDFETREISVVCPNYQNINALECAIKKAGFRCPCFRVSTN